MLAIKYFQARISMNTLSVFQKYLGQQSAHSNIIPTNITDINHTIGILQTIDKHLKKCTTHLHSLDSIKELMTQCHFMGEMLFEKHFLLSPINKAFYIQDLTLFFSPDSQEHLLAYISEKREEIASLLDQIFFFLEQEENPDSQPLSYAQNHSYSTHLKS